MKRLSLTMLAITVAGAAALSFSIVSCDSNAADPQVPGNSRGGVKGAHVNASNTATVGVERSLVNGGGEGSLSFDQETATLTVDNYNNSGGLRSVPVSPVNTWAQTLSGDWPASGNGGIRFTAFSGADISATLDVTQVTGSPTNDLSVIATYTGSGQPPQPVVTVVVRHCNGTVETVPGVPATTALNFTPPNGVCCTFLRGIHFDVVHSPLLGQCVWTLMWNKCCCFRVFFNGRWYDDVESISIRQVVTGGGYPYRDISEVRSTAIAGGISGPLAVRSEFTMSVPDGPTTPP